MDKACEMSSDAKQLDKLIPLLYRFALYALGNGGYAEKAVMDCCVGVYPKVVGRGYTTETLKLRYFRRLYFLCLLRFVRYDPQSVLAAHTKADEKNEGIIYALGELSRRERSMIVLRFLCHLKESDIAAACFMPRRIVRKRFATAAKRLHGTLCKDQ